MKQVVQAFILFFLLVTFFSCDCYHFLSGIVVDSQSGQVLEDVTITNVKKEWNTTQTDSSGYFVISAVSGGFRCPPLKIKFDKSLELDSINVKEEIGAFYYVSEK